MTPGLGPEDFGKWLETSATWKMAFSSGIRSIGMYLLDYGDYDGTLTVRLFSGATQVAEYTPPAGFRGNGSIAFLGMRAAAPFDSVEFQIAQLAGIPSPDFIGWDDIVVGL